MLIVMTRLSSWLGAILLLITAPIFASADNNNSQKFIERKDVQSFIEQMAQKHAFDRRQLTQSLARAQIQPKIIATMSKPAEKLPWHQYEGIFLTPQRINAGVKFWEKNGPSLVKAQKQYGVPPEIIVAIIGVESFYGRQAGQFKVLDALVTLGFDYPPRAPFFLSELEAFLLLAREEKWDPAQIKGSYAGAMGDPQFMPSSYRQFAVDFTGKGKRDLINNIDDAIGSVAHYFKAHGWETGQPVIFPAKVNGEQYKNVLAAKANPKPAYTLKQMTQSGVQASAELTLSPNSPQLFALIGLENKQGPEYWLGTQNFYTITRYNHSDHYAMAVYNLSQKIKLAYHQPPTSIY